MRENIRMELMTKYKDQNPRQQTERIYLKRSISIKNWNQTVKIGMKKMTCAGKIFSKTTRIPEHDIKTEEM